MMLKKMRLVSCSPDNTEILCALGVIDEVVGISKHCDFPLGLQDEKQIISDFQTADIDAIKALEPDLVFCSTYYQADMIKSLSENHLRVFVSQPSNLQSVWDNIHWISQLIGRPERGEMLLSHLQSLLLPQPQTGLKVFTEEWGSPIVIAAPWIHELVELAGGTPVLKEKLKFVHTNERYASAEEVADENPDVVLLPWCGCHGQVPLDKVKARPQWDNIKAVQNNQLYPLEDSFFVRPGPRLVEGYQILTKLFTEITNDAERLLTH